MLLAYNSHRLPEDLFPKEKCVLRTQITWATELARRTEGWDARPEHKPNSFETLGPFNLTFSEEKMSLMSREKYFCSFTDYRDIRDGLLVSGETWRPFDVSFTALKLLPIPVLLIPRWMEF